MLALPEAAAGTVPVGLVGEVALATALGVGALVLAAPAGVLGAGRVVLAALGGLVVAPPVGELLLLAGAAVVAKGLEVAALAVLLPFGPVKPPSAGSGVSGELQATPHRERLAKSVEFTAPKRIRFAIRFTCPLFSRRWLRTSANLSFYIILFSYLPSG
jgi:hypothetical protein